jgi:hypothetical protein
MPRAKAKAKVTPMNASASLPQSAAIPAGMKQMGGGYAATWSPEELGDSLHGVVSEIPKELTLNKGTKKENTTRVMEVTNMEGVRYALWESVVLSPLFDEVEQRGEGVEVFIQYDGLGKKKTGQNPPKLFTVAMAE